MKVLVTGSAGFIGSTLTERLLGLGYDVLGLDCFTSYYSKEQKIANIQKAKSHERYKFVEGDILEVDLAKILKDVDAVLHLAAQPGVRPSWSEFEVYVRNNVIATKKLLDEAVSLRLKKFIFASSSSVYGDAESYPTREDVVTQPVSPYGITKDACEKLCHVYHKSYSIPTSMLRFFTVYGPRQRPDMGFYRFIEKIMANEKITVYGDGNQIRDFTYVDDIVQGIVSALESDFQEETYNLGGGRPTRLVEAIRTLQDIMGIDVKIEHAETQQGDARKTMADISHAQRDLKYYPKMNLRSGLLSQVNWHRSRIYGRS